MSDSQIQVADLSKQYRVPERDSGLLASLRSLGKRRYLTVDAVRDVGFIVEEGEMVGLLGPNGAGKTTILKMLAGLLTPTRGAVTVDGYVPSQRDFDYLRDISMVQGNRSQMMWDIPAADSFAVLGEIYAIPKADYRRRLNELVDLLDLGDLLTKPVRNLSLGERMKCELVAGLLHRPRVLFLDEPTLGLDVTMQRRLREFLADYNRLHTVTTILTSHYMADVVALCPRVLLIHQGRLLYDGALNGLAEKLAPFKLVRISLREAVPETPELPAGTEIIEEAEDALTVRVDRAEAPALTSYLLQALPVADLSVEDPPVESVIDQIFVGGVV